MQIVKYGPLTALLKIFVGKKRFIEMMETGEKEFLEQRAKDPNYTELTVDNVATEDLYAITGSLRIEDTNLLIIEICERIKAVEQNTNLLLTEICERIKAMEDKMKIKTETNTHFLKQEEESK